jgi:hypothetical protein
MLVLAPTYEDPFAYRQRDRAILNQLRLASAANG